MKRSLVIAFLVCSLTAWAETDWNGEMRRAFFLDLTQVVTNHTERDVQANEYRRVYLNRDNCNYTLIRSAKSKYVLFPGENVVERRALSSKSDGFNMQKTNFHCFRGEAVACPDSMIPYVLPLRGEQVQVSQRDRYQLYFVHPGDTIYAMRRGQVCLSGSEHSVVIAQADGTFAIYGGVASSFHNTGRWVETGQALGVANEHRVAICYIYLDASVTITDNSTARDVYQFISPALLLSDGVQRLPLGLHTLSPGVLTSDIQTMDMSKREKKRWLKEHSK